MTEAPEGPECEGVAAHHYDLPRLETETYGKVYYLADPDVVSAVDADSATAIIDYMIMDHVTAADLVKPAPDMCNVIKYALGV